MSAPVLHRLSPVWLVDDVDAACAYYAEKLGFGVCFTAGEPAHYGAVSRDEVTISFSKAALPGQRNGVCALSEGCQFADAYVWTKDIRGLYGELHGAEGVSIEDELKRYGYGMTDFVVIDPNGYKLCFGQRTDEVPNADSLPEGVR